MPTKTEKTETTKTTKATGTEKEIKMDKYNPANLAVPSTFDIESLLINIDNPSRPDEQPKKYMPVAARLSWYLQNHPDLPSPIPTLIKDENGIVIYEAVLLDENGTVLSKATGIENVRNYEDPCMAYQKAETQAVGRCLRNRGYGIAFEDEGDELQPIDQTKIDGALPSIADLNEGNNSVTAKVDNSECSECSLEDKYIAVLETGFPMKFVIGKYDFKHQPTWKVITQLKKAGKNLDTMKEKLKWGLDKNLQGSVNENPQLKYPEYATLLLALTSGDEEMKTAYKKALSTIKHKLEEAKEE